MIIGIASGGFDPVHVGHIRMFNEGKVRCDKLVVILNSDAWLERKKGAPFMPFEERMEVLNNIRAVDTVMPVDDSDGSVKKALVDLNFIEKERRGHSLVFLNGGDRIPRDTLEADYCLEHGIDLLWHVGGAKVQSSSWLTGQSKK